MPTDTTRFRFRHLSWRTLILAALTLIAFFAVANVEYSYPVPILRMGGYMEGSAVSSPPMAPSQTTIAPDSYPYPGNGASAEDTREFLKVHYNAQMKTRDVGELARRVETTVRGYDGRIDSQSIATKYAHIGFVVPMSKYETFRSELESLVGKRFLEVNISSQNLLPQKLSIEEQQKNADAALASYQSSRAHIVSTHASVSQQLTKLIATATAELSRLQEQPPSSELDDQIASLRNELNSLRAQLMSENNSYTSRLASIDAQIKRAQDWQKAVATQDEKLMDDLATMNGTVSIRWINLWELAQLYLPGYSIPGILAALTALSFYFDRRRFYTRNPQPTQVMA